MLADANDRSVTHSTAGLILVLLLVIDALLLAIFLSHRLLGEPSSGLFNIGRDHGFPEFFQYIKEIWFCLILFAAFLRKRQVTLFLWSALGGALLLDDALQLHERAGHLISNALQLTGAMGIRGQDFGEVIAALVLGLIFGIPLLLKYFYDDRELRRFSRNLCVLLAGLVFFGVVIDLFVHRAQNLILFIIEDGGEMIMISIMVWYSLRYFESGTTDLIKQVDRFFDRHRSANN